MIKKGYNFEIEITRTTAYKTLITTPFFNCITIEKYHDSHEQLKSIDKSYSVETS